MGILFFDIDDTLFSHQTFTIPESTHEALARARANGHHLVLASGRSHSGIVDLYDDTLFECAVCCSGGCVFWNDELIIDHPIPQDKA
ncbi:MAG: HAD family phosphatase, partial [Solobacterium sp.]|nr:HAD family phosphatase [Solobacterium sp.]